MRQRVFADFVIPQLHPMRQVLALVLMTVCLGNIHPAWSQEVTSAFTGSVVDPTGASKWIDELQLTRLRDESSPKYSQASVVSFLKPAAELS
jgi:hypothetical protein